MASQLLAGGTAARIQLRCWGDFAIADADSGTDLKPRGRKARALLAYLAMHPGKPISRDRLMGLLWGDRADEQARASLRQSLFELRGFGNGVGLLAIDRESVELRSSVLVTDIDQIAEAARTGDYDRMLEMLPDVDETLFANLDGIDDGFDEWLRIERTRQRDTLVSLVSDASASALTDGRVRAARALHARLLELSDGDHPTAPAPLTVEPLVAPAPAAEPKPRPARWPAAAAIALALGIAGTAGFFTIERGERRSDFSRGSEAYGLNAAAREIIRERDGQKLPAAEDLLRRAVAVDPGFAPAWASLASVIAMSKRTPDGLAEAERHARRALALDSNLPEAHGVLGMVLGFQTDEARAAIKRAARLSPNDAEIQFWLSNVYGVEGDYGRRLAALRRAVAIDPQWHRAVGTAAMAAWEMGHAAEAQGYVAKLRAANLEAGFQCAYAIDWADGDYSEVVRDTLALRERLSEASAADRKLGIALLVLGYEQPARLLLRLPPPLWRVASDAGPAPGELEALLREADRDERADLFALTALRQTLKAGRVAEIVALYDRRVGRLGAIAAGEASHVGMVTDGLQVALALRAVGREREAMTLLARADAAVRYSLGKGAAPNWVHAAAASIWVVQGRKEEALAALQTAIDRGWHYSPMTPLPDMADIPSLASLRGDPKFERLRARLRNHLARERRELGALKI